MSGFAKVFLIITLSLIVGVGLYYFTVIPKKNDLITKTKKLKQLKEQLQVLKESTSKLAEWEKAKADYEKLLRKMQSKSSNQRRKVSMNVVSNYLRALENLITSYKGIDPDITLGDVSSRKDRKSGTNTLTSNIIIQAHLATALNLFSDMADLKLRNVVSIDKVSIGLAEKSVNSQDPLLKIKLKLRVKMYGGGE